MLTKIIEKQFIVMWGTLLACVLGYFAYQKMPIELLPGIKEKRFAVVVPNPGMAPGDLMKFVEPTVSSIARALRLKASMQADANATRFVAVFNPNEPNAALRKRFEEDLKRQFLQRNIRLPVSVIELGLQQAPVLTLMIPAHVIKTSPNLLTQVREELLQLQGVEKVVHAGAPLLTLDLQPTKKEVLVPQLRSHADTLSFFQNTLRFSQVTGSHFKSIVSSSPSDTSNWLKSKFSIAPTDPVAEHDSTASFSDIFAEQKASPTEFSFYEGEPVELINIHRFASENDLSVSERVHSWLTTFLKTHPDQISVVWDVADYIRAADSNVSDNLRDGTWLTCLCVYIFMRRFGQTFLVSASIPISILTAFPIMSAMHISRNVMSLAGIALAVGIVVDTTLTVLEDMVGQIAAGRSPQVAAIRAARNNFKPVLLTSLSSLTVFIPILFLDGFVGTLFYDLSMTFIIAQLTSFIVSVFIMPVIAAVYYSLIPIPSTVIAKSGYAWTNALKQKTLATCYAILISPLRSLIFSLVLLFIVALSFVLTPKSEFLPQAHANQFRLNVLTSPLLTENEKQIVVQKIDKSLQELQAQERKINWNGLRFVADFKTSKAINLEASRHALQVSLRPYEIILSRFSPFDLAATDGHNIEFYVDLTGAKRAAVQGEIEKLQGVRSQRWSNDFKIPTLNFNNLASTSLNYGLPQSLFAQAWPTISGMIPVGELYDSNAKEFRLVTLNAAASRFHLLPSAHLLADKIVLASALPRDLTAAHVYWNHGRLSEKVELTTEPGASDATHDALLSLFKKYDVAVTWDADTNENLQSMRKLFYCLAIAIVLTTVLLYMQQRSVTLTITVLFTFVWAPAGAIPGLWFHNELLNGSALVGFILLAGSVVNNGILIVEIVQKYRQEQVEPAQACLNAIRERSLNVIITSLTTVFGMLPLVFETGTGSEMYRGLAIVVVYGVLVSTPMSLIGVPCWIVVFEAYKEKFNLLLLKLRILLTAKAAREVTP